MQTASFFHIDCRYTFQSTLEERSWVLLDLLLQYFLFFYIQLVDTTIDRRISITSRIGSDIYQRVIRPLLFLIVLPSFAFGFRITSPLIAKTSGSHHMRRWRCSGR